MELVQSGRVSLECEGLEWPVAFGEGFADCDVGLFVAVADLVSSGLFSGPRVSVLLERLAIRLEAVGEVIGCGDITLAESAYYAIVAQLEAQLGLPTHSVREEVREMQLVAALYGSGNQVPRGVVAHGLPCEVAGYMSVVNGTVAVPVFGKTGSKLPANDQVILTQSVYRAVLALAVLPGERPLFPLARARDGVYDFIQSADVAAGCDLDALPSGYYRLPGAFGCVVNREVIKTILDCVWVSPARERKRGYCYLHVVPPLMRPVLANALGSFPKVSQLVDLCPEVYTWSAVEAKVYPVSDAATGEYHYHVATVGRLPQDVPLESRIGADAAKAAIPSHFNAVFADFERRVGETGSVSSKVSSTSADRVLSLPRSTVSHLRSVSVGASATGGSEDRELISRTRTPVFRLQPGAMRATGPVWTEYDDPKAREWANRLASGPPLGHRILQQLVRSKPDSLPDLPVAEGGRMVALPGASMTGAKQAKWSARDSPIPGWSIESMCSVSAHSISAVPPRPGVLCRYEISSEQPFEINGTLMPAHRTAVWLDGNLLVTRLGRHAAIWRMWHEAGAAALGVDFMALHLAYQCPTIVPARKDRKQIACARLVGEDHQRGELLYRANVPCGPGEGEVHVYVNDCLSSEPVYLAVSAPGLVQIMVHGVVVAAIGTTAVCVSDLSSLSVGYCIANDRGGRRSREIIFELRRTRGVGLSRGKVVPSNRLLPTSESASF